LFPRFNRLQFRGRGAGDAAFADPNRVLQNVAGRSSGSGSACQHFWESSAANKVLSLVRASSIEFNLCLFLWDSMRPWIGSNQLSDLQKSGPNGDSLGPFGCGGRWYGARQVIRRIQFLIRCRDPRRLFNIAHQSAAHR
jgi:hypothetical protein